MFSLTSIILVVGSLSRVSTQSTSTPVPTFCFEGACYKRPYGYYKNWTEAQKRCENYGSTLPIVNDPVHQRSFEAACRNLTSSYEIDLGLWIGARAFSIDSIYWMWLDGSIYSRSDLQSREYQTSYAYASNTSNGVFAYAATSTNAYSYICYYPTPGDRCINDTGQTAYYIENRCYVKYDETMSWFGARNNCLSHNGDLASFTQLSLLNGKINYNGIWIGLRNIQWKWYNSVTGLSSDVTFTLWSPDQPNDAVPSCISTDGDDKFPGWRNYNCSRYLPFICQLNKTASTTPPRPTSSASPTVETYSLASALTSRDPPNTPTNPSSSTATPTNPSFSTATPTNPSSSTATPTNPSSSTATPTSPSSSTATPTNPSFSTATPTNPSFSTATPTNPSSTITTPTIPSSTSTTPTTAKTTPSSSTTTSTTEEKTNRTHTAENLRHETRSVHIALAVGLGLGIGVPVIILILAVIIIIVWRKRQSSFPGGNSHSTNSLNNSKPDTSEMNEMENERTVSRNNSSAQYTSVKPAMDVDARLPSKQGIVYEPLSFN